MIKWSRGLAHEDQVSSEVWKWQKEKGKKTSFGGNMEVLHSFGNNPRSGNAVFRIGVLEALRATPNLETESSSLETICLSMVEDKSI